MIRKVMLRFRFVAANLVLSCLAATWFALGCAATGGGTSKDGSEDATSGGGSDSDLVGTGAAANDVGTGGQAGTGGALIQAGGGSGSGAGGTGLPSVVECTAPSIDRLREWLASGEGPTTPATGSLLVAEGDSYVARAAFTSASEWHVLAIWFGNEFGATIDLSDSSGFTLTYSATADFYFQLRPAAQWSGGDKWHMPIPSTAGQVVTTFFPFESSEWTERLGTPPHSFLEALSDASGFAVVGNSQNELSFYGLQIDGFTPDCKEL